MMKMVQAMKLAQNWQNTAPSVVMSSPAARSAITGTGTTGGGGGATTTVRFTQSQPENNNLDQHMDQKDKKTMTQNPNDKTGDAMSHSFGEGYATRSDEEGFGGIYGGNQSTGDESHPEYDREQGSEVKETEKARNQKAPQR